MLEGKRISRRNKTLITRRTVRIVGLITCGGGAGGDSNSGCTSDHQRNTCNAKCDKQGCQFNNCQRFVLYFTICFN
jgi:hypothetical protein